eukprot:COSAG01_NODE_29818_length_628_cov_38.353497_1_plen_59_part_10
MWYMNKSIELDPRNPYRGVKYSSTTAVGALTFIWADFRPFSDISCHAFLGALVTAHLVH